MSNSRVEVVKNFVGLYLIRVDDSTIGVYVDEDSAVKAAKLYSDGGIWGDQKLVWSNEDE